MSADPSRLGTVRDVQGSSLTVLIDAESPSGLTFIDGDPYRVGQVGGFVRIPTGYRDAIGVITQAGASAAPSREATDDAFLSRWLRIELVGESTEVDAFSRGISMLPTIGSPAFVVSLADLALIYGSLDSPASVRLGSVASSEGIPAMLDLNKLVTRHSAVVGATGSGKSTAVATILNAISDPGRYSSARVLVLDIHGEYVSCFGDQAVVFGVGPNEGGGHARPLMVPYWALAFDELLRLTFGELDDSSRAAVRDKLVELKRLSVRADDYGLTEDEVTVDTPVPFSAHAVWDHFFRQCNATHTVGPGSPQSRATEALETNDDGDPIEPGDPERVIPPRYRALAPNSVYTSGSILNMRRQVDAFGSRLRDPRYSFLFHPGPWKPDLDGKTQQDLDVFLSQWFGNEEPICVLDLSGVPTSITNAVVAVLLRLTYDSMFWGRYLSEGARERPILLVLEEAHSYLGQLGPQEARWTVQRIVKEGRKYGVGAMLVSQRPSEVDETILSQCGTVISMRLSNQGDRSRVSGAAMDSLGGLLSSLPVLRTGEALVLGEATSLPTRVMVDQPAENRRPRSSDPLVVDIHRASPGGWDRRQEPAVFSEVVSRWRRQSPQVGEEERQEDE